MSFNVGHLKKTIPIKSLFIIWHNGANIYSAKVNVHNLYVSRIGIKKQPFLTNTQVCSGTPSRNNAYRGIPQKFSDTFLTENVTEKLFYNNSYIIFDWQSPHPEWSLITPIFFAFSLNIRCHNIELHLPGIGGCWYNNNFEFEFDWFSVKIYPITQALGFVVICFILVISSVPGGITRFIYPYSSGRLFHWPWNNCMKCRKSLMGFTWWRLQMVTFSTLLALCEGNSPVAGEFPSQRPVTWSLDVFFDLCQNKRLSKQSWCWWFEMPSHSLWRHCNGNVKSLIMGFITKCTISMCNICSSSQSNVFIDCFTFPLHNPKCQKFCQILGLCKRHPRNNGKFHCLHIAIMHYNLSRIHWNCSHQQYKSPSEAANHIIHNTSQLDCEAVYHFSCAGSQKHNVYTCLSKLLSICK